MTRSNRRNEDGQIDAQPVLLSVAGVSLTLTGFAGLTVSLQHRELKDWPPQTRIQLRSLVESGLFAVALALFPILLLYLGLGENTLWHPASLVLALGIVGMTARVVRRGAPLMPTRVWGRWFPPASVALLSAVAIANFANVVVPTRLPTTFGIYLAGLLSVVLVTAALFWRIVTFSTTE